MIISFASSKGGVGKTTTCICLAGEMALRGARVAILDADPNLPALHWRRLAKVAVDVHPSTDDSIIDDINRAAADYDHVLIDLPGVLEKILLYAAGKSNLTIIPSQVSALDMIEARKVVREIEKIAGVTQRDIPFRILWTQMQSLRSKVADHAMAEVQRWKLPVFATQIGHRVAYKEMVFHGRLPQEVDPKSNASANIASLADEIFGAAQQRKAANG